MIGVFFFVKTINYFNYANWNAKKTMFAIYYLLTIAGPVTKYYKLHNYIF